ncbi:hypothetical protein [Nonomuraea sp. B10E15]|uniref:hypothetical protein n=1 Tax=Nonomuraea sp. B10E15 TaxID=3153560 RepID=UPI00325FA0AA
MIADTLASLLLARADDDRPGLMAVVLQARHQRRRLPGRGAQQESERPAHTPPPITLGNETTTISAGADRTRKDIRDTQT